MKKSSLLWTLIIGFMLGGCAEEKGAMEPPTDVSTPVKKIKSTHSVNKTQESEGGNDEEKLVETTGIIENVGIHQDKTTNTLTILPLEQNWMEEGSQEKAFLEVIIFDVSRIDDTILSTLKKGRKIKIVHPTSFAYMSPMLGFAFELEILENE